MKNQDNYQDDLLLPIEAAFVLIAINVAIWLLILIPSWLEVIGTLLIHWFESQIHIGFNPWIR